MGFVNTKIGKSAVYFHKSNPVSRNYGDGIDVGGTRA